VPLKSSELKTLSSPEEDQKVVMDLEIGDSIIVTGGAWKDTQGVISAINQQKQMVTIQVELFGRATPVEISFSEVKKIG
jgi:transcriptional antiterminator NusG